MRALALQASDIDPSGPRLSFDDFATITERALAVLGDPALGLH